MKNKIKLVLVLFFAVIQLKAQNAEIKNDGKSSEIGFHLSQFQNDFGFGLDYTSPYLIKDRYLAFTFRTNAMYLEHLEKLKTTWTSYFNLQLGVIGNKTEITENIVIYGEGGVIAVIPNSNFSTYDVHIGGYGLFGFQFNFDTHNAYFIELGGVGVESSADKVPTEPIYSNGFLVNVGYKVIF